MKNKELIDENWIIVGYDSCKYTKNAIRLLKSKGIEFIYLPISPETENETNIKFFEQKLKPIAKKFDSKHTTYPYVFDKGIFVGGYTNLVKYSEGVETRRLKIEQIQHYQNLQPFEKFVPLDESEYEESYEEDIDSDDFKFKNRLENFLKERFNNS